MKPQTIAYQAIVTKTLPATDTKPYRIKATCSRGSITVSQPDYIDRIEERHRFAAKELINRFCAEDAEQYGSPIKSNPWNKPFITGALPSGDYCHVFKP